ncbi:MAG: DNA-formamidopyrimidine glycosylase [Bacilli bacterium]|nr:DNA-formamidopyrimidine glycosylase [Bacilli bacterium]
MPEIAEVRTVARTLNKRIVGKKIIGLTVNYKRIIEGDVKDFEEKVKDQYILSVDNYGKWLFISLGEYTIMSHLRMEGKYFIKEITEDVEKHEHIIFHLEDGTDLRYHDTRKFGRMRVVKTDEIYKTPEISKLGIEPDNKALTGEYLYNMVKGSNLPIKTLLLDQSIINGLGNIYVNEVLFAARIHPETLGNKITLNDAKKMVEGARVIIEKATEKGGTTIRSYTSSLGVYGSYQDELMVQSRDNEKCKVCGSGIEKIRVGGRGTYFCPKCQKKK